MKKHHLALILLIGLICAPAKADLLTIALDSLTLTGSPGDVLQFSGTLTNTTSVNLFLNADNFNIAGFDPSAIDDSPFFANAPLFLGPNGSTADISLFDIAIPNPFATGNDGGSFQILGGIDADAQEVIGSVDFTVAAQQTAVPEPTFRITLSVTLVLLLLTHIVGDVRSRAYSRNKLVPTLPAAPRADQAAPLAALADNLQAAPPQSALQRRPRL